MRPGPFGFNALCLVCRLGRVHAGEADGRANPIEPDADGVAVDRRAPPGSGMRSTGSTRSISTGKTCKAFVVSILVPQERLWVDDLPASANLW